MSHCTKCGEYISQRRYKSFSLFDIEKLIKNKEGELYGMNRKQLENFIRTGLDVCRRCQKERDQSNVIIEDRNKTLGYYNIYKENDEKYLRLLEEETQMQNFKCSTDTLLSGDELDLSKIIVFVYSKGEELECYDKEELMTWFNSQEKLYYWKRGPLKDKPIYKLPYTGTWIDDNVYDFITSGYKTIFLYKKESHAIGSSFGVSQTHGAVFDIFTGIPIERSEIVDLELLRKKVAQNKDNVDISKFPEQSSELPPTLGRLSNLEEYEDQEIAEEFEEGEEEFEEGEEEEE